MCTECQECFLCQRLTAVCCLLKLLEEFEFECVRIRCKVKHFLLNNRTAGQRSNKRKRIPIVTGERVGQSSFRLCRVRPTDRKLKCRHAAATTISGRSIDWMNCVVARHLAICFVSTTTTKMTIIERVFFRRR